MNREQQDAWAEWMRDTWETASCNSHCSARYMPRSCEGCRLIDALWATGKAIARSVAQKEASP